MQKEFKIMCGLVAATVGVDESAKTDPATGKVGWWKRQLKVFQKS